MSDDVADLKDRIFLLEEQLASYRALPEWDLTAGEQIIFETLHIDRAASLETFSVAMELAGYGPSTYGSIRCHISILRKKLRDHNAPYRVKTHYGIGWSLVVLKTP